MSQAALSPTADQSLPTARVLLVVDDESLDRFGTIAQRIIVGVADAAAKVTVLARTHRAPHALELGPCAVVHAPPRRWPMGSGLTPEVSDLLEDGRFNVVHCLSADLLQWASRQPELARLPLAVHLTDRVDLQRWVGLQRAPRTGRGIWVLPASPTLFREVLATRSVRASYVKLVRLAIIPPAGTPVLSDPDHIPSALVISPLGRDSGLETVLRAMRRVVTPERPAALFVLGRGPAERRLRRLSETLGLQGQVTFVGHIAQWADAILGCDVLVVPKTRRRWDSHVLEAMASGRVVLAPRDLAEDYLVHGQTALLFDPAAPENLAEAWQRVLDDPATARRLGAEAQQFVRQHHSPSAMAEALLDLYGQMMSAAACPSHAPGVTAQ